MSDKRSSYLMTYHPSLITFMRSLFLKIFLWFWLAMVLVNVATFFALELTGPKPFGAPLRDPRDTLLAGFALSAAETYERDGIAGLTPFMEQMDRASGIKGTLLDSRGAEVSGQAVPAEIQELGQRVIESGRAEGRPSRFGPLEARPVKTSNGKAFVLVARMPPGFMPPALREQVFRLCAILLVGGTLCYMLARYLTAPLMELRTATRSLAEGNLSARVSPAIGKRRDELATLAADFDLMAERIESLLKSQRRLLGDISHELRSPLARLSVALELARQRAGADAEGALDRIEREAESLNEMIAQLLTITRLEAGASQMRLTKVDLERLVREVSDDADFEAQSANRVVRINDCAPGALVMGDEKLLRSAVENVVRNAVRHTAKGTEVEVNLHCERNGDEPHAEISVRDHGRGVPEGELTEIFRPFYRVEEARDRLTGGAGLGLAITARAISLHGGTVTAMNAPGGGLVVNMRIPISEPNKHKPFEGA